MRIINAGKSTVGSQKANNSNAELDDGERVI
jgi:hypothetical protein